MINSFKSHATRVIFEGEQTPDLPAGIQGTALRKLQQLHLSKRLDDLRVPPGNRLEQLKGGRKGQHSIRINDRYRICFRWTDSGVENVEIVDYH